MSHFYSRAPICALAAIATIIGALTAQIGVAHSSPLKTLYSFCSQANCTDGNLPTAGLLRDSSGNLYGTTLYGGTSNGGTIFQLTPQNRTWIFKTIYNFCSKTLCSDGHNPPAALIADDKGDLYGTTQNGGQYSLGDVFELIPDKAHENWSLKVLYSFCRSQSACPDGRAPNSSLTYNGAATGAPYDGHSPLFGTAMGIVFELLPDDNQKKWSEKVLYTFCAKQTCTDGDTPVGGVLVDSNGNLFGNAAAGGDMNDGVVYELTPNGSEWDQTRLHSFCALADCRDGRDPQGPLSMDANGNLFGATAAGGTKDAGTIFKLVPNGVDSVETVLHSFCADKKCKDGRVPEDGVMMDLSGSTFGVAASGGSRPDGYGTVYRWNGAFDVLYTFGKRASHSSGLIPHGIPVFDPAGNLFAVTAAGGATDNGTVFELVP